MAAGKMLWDFQGFGDRVALIGENRERVTYGELHDLSEAMAGIDQSRPLVLVFCRNTLGILCGYAALVNSGYPVMMMSAKEQVQMRKQVLNTYRPAMILIPEEQYGDYSNMQKIRSVGDCLLLKTNYPANYPVHPDLCQLLTTSGSTGSAKYVRQSRENILCNASAIAGYLDIQAEDRSITTLPLQYTYSLSMLHAGFMRGASVVVTDLSVLDNDFWDLLEDEKVSMFHGVPGTYEFLDRMEMFSEDFPTVKTMTQAGGKLNRELHASLARYARTYGKRFIVMYGQSEATAAISWLEPEHSLEKAGSVGHVISGGSLVLEDADGQAVTSARMPGEIVYRGGNVAMGYAYCGEDLAKGDEWGGVLRTGDVGEMDEDGFLYIVGRLKRYIKVSGHRISLDEIDEKILEELNVFCVSSGTDDHLLIFVTSEKDRAAVEKYIRSTFYTVRNSFTTAVIDAFPKNEAGKVLYGELQSLAEELLK